MMNTRRLTGTSSAAAVRSSGNGTMNPLQQLTREPSLLTREISHGAGPPSVRSNSLGSVGRRCSVIMSNRQPIALLETINGNEVSIRPVLRQQGNSVHTLFEDLYRVEEPRRSEMSTHPSPHLQMYRGENLDDIKDFQKQCQWKGEQIKQSDYMLLNITVIFIISVIVAAILFFSLWKGEAYVLYVVLGITILLVVAALLTVKLHFWLKGLGYNLLIRYQRDRTITRTVKQDQEANNSEEKTAALADALP